ncbi:MAG: hypothetical protein IKA47_04780 [Oscillospiraceae bacterium]|nr:hypothetical protein [Oscillospiraceae bacterium]
MRRMMCFILLAAAFLFVGFQAKSTPSRYVTRIDISGFHNGTVLQRSYTGEEKMRSVLMYLRLLQTGEPIGSPESTPTDIYEVTVNLSSGEKRNYSLVDHRYFRKNSSGWESISADQAARLYSLMRFFESDV